MAEIIEQRSEEWFGQRRGIFTASEIYKLMGVRGLGDTGKNYAIDKAIEHLFGDIEESFLSLDMKRGIELEPLAFSKFSEIVGLDFIDVENCGFFKICKNSGASPDGIMKDAILEIKCPKSTTFFKLVATNEINPNYFYQMQMQMMATGKNKGYFFNYIIIEGTEFWHTIEVLKDDVICDKITARILEAVEIKKEYISKIKEKNQWKLKEK